MSKEEIDQEQDEITSKKKVKKKEDKSEKKGKTSEVDFEPTLDEELEAVMETVLSPTQRRKKAMVFRKNKAKILRGRKIASRKKASSEKLKKRAKRQAIELVKKKLTKQRDYADLSPSEKTMIDTKVAKKQAAIERLAKKLLPKVRKDEQQRMSSMHEEKEDCSQETPKKKHHQLLNKDGTVKHDMRFKRYWKNRIKEEAENRDEMRLKDKQKREKEDLDSKQEREMDRVKTNDLRKKIRDINKDEKANSDVKKEHVELTNEQIFAVVDFVLENTIPDYVHKGVPHDPWGIEKIKSKTTLRNKYANALKDIKKIMKKAGNKKNIGAVSHDISRMYQGLDARTLMNMAMKELRMSEEHGAGEWGTDELRRKYMEDTPGQYDEDFEKMMNEATLSKGKIDVVKDGKVVGQVNKQTTSIGAAKLAKTKKAKFGKVDGKYVWIAYDQ